MTDLGGIAGANTVRQDSCPYPEQVPAERGVTLLLFLLSFLYLCLFRRFTSMEPDEGILLQGAQRILAGQVLYRDFFSFYTPGSYYGLALLFRMFGSSLMVARTALALTGAVLSLITYLLARRVCSRPIASTMAALATFTALPYRFLVLHNWQSTLWACLALYCAVRLRERGGWHWSFALGSLAAITTLVEQSKGAGLCIGLAVGFLATFVGRNKLQPRKTLCTRAERLALILGFAWPLALTFAYFASQHAASVMISDWLWPLHHYSAANRVPYGYQNWSDEARQELFGADSLPFRLIKILAVSPCFWIPALPIVAMILFGCWIVQGRQPSVREDPEALHNPDAADGRAYYLLLTAGYAGLALSAMAVRADIIHFMYLQPLNCLLLAWLVGGRGLPGGVLPAIRPFFCAYVVAALALFGLAPLLGTLAPHGQLATRRGIVTTRGQDTVVKYIDANVPADSTILVYPYLPLYYYLTATNAPGRYDFFQPGMNTAEQGSEIIALMASRRVRTVLLETAFAEKIPHSWPETPRAAVVRDPVANYILGHYRVCQVLTSPMDWRFMFMVSQQDACP